MLRFALSDRDDELLRMRADVRSAQSQSKARVEAMMTALNAVRRSRGIGERGVV